MRFLLLFFQAKLVGGEQKELKEPPPAEIAQSKESPSPI